MIRAAATAMPKAKSDHFDAQKDSLIPELQELATPPIMTVETTREEYMIKVAIIIGSTRPGRNGEAVAKGVYEIARKS